MMDRLTEKPEFNFGWNPRNYTKTRIEREAGNPIFLSEEASVLQQKQHDFREWVRKLLVLPAPGIGGVSARVLSCEEHPNYRREFIVFETRPGVTACGFFIIPKPFSETPLPAVLCLPGHGRGVDTIIGILPDGTQREWGAWDEYANDYALQCVAHGYAVFALEQIGFGRRRDAQAQAAGGDASSCTRDAMAALMLGETLLGWRVWDALKAIDLLQSRPEVNPEAVAILGISGGGTVSLFTACLDSRIGACVVSGYFNTFRDSILAVDHCVDNFVPGLLGVCEMPELAGLIAPRPFFVESGTHDPIFPLQGFEHAASRASEIYRLFGAEAKFGWEIFEGGHVFHGEDAFPFLKASWR